MQDLQLGGPLWSTPALYSFESRSAPTWIGRFSVRQSRIGNRDVQIARLTVAGTSADTGSFARSDGRGIDLLTGKGLW